MELLLEIAIIDAGADVNEQNADGYTAWVCRFNTIRIKSQNLLATV